MPHIDKTMIRSLTRLSRIACTEAEEEALLIDLQKISQHLEQLQEINTENVAPCLQVLEGLVNITRKDEVQETLSREVFLANVPSHVDGLIRIPTNL